jgi:hypothetical protein
MFSIEILNLLVNRAERALLAQIQARNSGEQRAD